MTDRIPYTYCLTHKESGKHYYGSRTAKGCFPGDLWVSYFTSSRAIKDMISQEGKQAFSFRVMRVFEDPDSCLIHETKFLLRVDAANNPKFLNRHNGGMNFSRAGKPGTFLGKQHSPETRALLSSQKLGKPNGPQSEEICRKKSERMSGPLNPMYGVKWTPEQRAKLSRTGTDNGMFGRKHSDESKKKMSETKKINKFLPNLHTI